MTTTTKTPIALEPGESIDWSTDPRLVIIRDDGGDAIVGRIESTLEGDYLGCFKCGQGIDRADGGCCQSCRESDAAQRGYDEVSA